MKTTANDFGKVRVYHCPCSGYCIRPLHGQPKPCDRCGLVLADRPYVIDDHSRRIRELHQLALAKSERAPSALRLAGAGLLAIWLIAIGLYVFRLFA